MTSFHYCPTLPLSCRTPPPPGPGTHVDDLWPISPLVATPWHGTLSPSSRVWPSFCCHIFHTASQLITNCRMSSWVTDVQDTDAGMITLLDLCAYLKVNSAVMTPGVRLQDGGTQERAGMEKKVRARQSYGCWQGIISGYKRQSHRRGLSAVSILFSHSPTCWAANAS